MPHSLLGCALSCLLAAGQVFGVNLRGAPVERLTHPGTEVVVLFFAASDCPISNRYLPEMMRLRREFATRPVAFWWVYPNPGETAEGVAAHQRQFGLDGDTILDTGQELSRMAHATVTPEAAVFLAGGGNSGADSTPALREVYRGRVDDRYSALGTARPRATRHFLEDAIGAALAGRAAAPAETEPVGCSIVPLAAAR